MQKSSLLCVAAILGVYQVDGFEHKSSAAEEGRIGKQQWGQQQGCKTDRCRREELKRRYALQLKYFTELLKSAQEEHHRRQDHVVYSDSRSQAQIPSSNREGEIDTVTSSQLSQIFSPSILQLVPDTQSVQSQLLDKKRQATDVDRKAAADSADLVDSISQAAPNQLPSLMQTFFSERVAMGTMSTAGMEAAATTPRPPTTTTPTTTTATPKRDDMKTWYLQHMAAMLQSSSAPTKATTAAPAAATSGVCPSHCTCSCPSIQTTVAPPPSPNTMSPVMGNTAMVASDANKERQKLNLGLTLIPCGRSAIYNLDLAVNLCRRRVSIDANDK